jgi:RimJ/RimL family protein N-acetyltransferase
MTTPSRSVRLMQAADIDAITNYWLSADAAFLSGMGVALQLLPTRNQLSQMLQHQLQLPVEQRQSFCVIWELDGRAAGHCNTNPTDFGKEAAMHLHLWDSSLRRQGLGIQWLRMSIPLFFEHLKLQTLYSEPYALNAARTGRWSRLVLHL